PPPPSPPFPSTTLFRSGVPAAFVYVALFALGSIGGMALLTGAAGVPLARIARRPGAHAALLACVGAVSLVVGVAWGMPILERLLDRKSTRLNSSHVSIS